MDVQGVQEAGRGGWSGPIPSLAAGAVVAVVGTLVVLGWPLDAVIVPSANPASPMVRLNTGFCFAVAGAGLVLAGMGRVTAARAAGVVAAVVGALTLVEYAFHTSLGIDQLVFDDGSRSVGRMAPNTALAFALVGVALAVLPSRRRGWDIAEGLALAGGMIGWLGLIGYAADLPELLHVGGFLRIALPSAICFTLLGVAIAIGPAAGRLATLVGGRGPAGPLVRRLFTAVVLVPPLVALPLRAADDQGTVTLLLIATIAVTLLGIAMSFASSLEVAEREAQERAELLDLAHDAVIVREPLTARITYFNREAEALYGYSAQEMRGRATHELFDTGPEAVEAIDTALLAGGRWDGELEHRRKDGVRIVVASRQSLRRDANGTPMAIIELNSDVTERRRAERAVELSNVELEQFASVASHDLQEPLRTISGFAELLAQRHAGALDEDGHRYLTFITSGVTRMQALIDGLLTYSKTSQGGLNVEVVSAGDAVDRALSSLEATVTAAGAEVDVGELPVVVANAGALTQVFQNLLSNALKFGNEHRPEVAVSADRRGDAWCFAVADNGIGIAPAHADRVFRMFQRLHAEGEYAGTGIGLAICKRVVERHGGSIWCEPRPGGGTVFRFTMPDGAAGE